MQLREEGELAAMEAQMQQQQDMEFNHPELDAQPRLMPENVGEAPQAPQAEPATPFVRKEKKVGRNEPCPCGSGKKYKQCHGKLA